MGFIDLIGVPWNQKLWKASRESEFLSGTLDFSKLRTTFSWKLAMSAALSSGTMNYQNSKMTSMLKDADDKRVAHREKALLVFTFQLLVDKGYFNAAAALSKECTLSLEEFSICDNIDLHGIFIEFETYYHLRYQRYPQYFKKTGATSATDQLLEKMKANPYRRGSASAQAKEKTMAIQKPIGNGNQKYAEAESGGLKLRSADSKLEAAKQAMASELRGHMDFGEICSSKDSNDDSDGIKLLNPISALDFPTDDMRIFAEIIRKDIVLKGLNTKWNDVIGLDKAKSVLQEALIYTKDFVDFFGHGLAPWNGLLLYGPPGVGKTLLAKAVATECKTTFFNISSASIVSKWRGDSEKMVKVLFDLARYYAPSTIFFDEFDALGSSRDTAGETDASRRLKSELLQQMDGILSSSSQDRIFILAATNMPWELDPAILRRLEKRIYIPLPSPAERGGLLKLNIERIVQTAHETSKHKNTLLFKIDYEYLAVKTNCYSGSDLHQIVKEAVVLKFRQRYSQHQEIRQLVIQTEDILTAISTIPPTVSIAMIQKFQNWDSHHQPN